MSAPTPRLLILDDRKKDVESLLRQAAIQDQFGKKEKAIYCEGTSGPQLKQLANASIVVARTLEDAKLLSSQQKFDFIISDLLLFKPDNVDAFAEDNYFPKLPLDDRREQIAKPSGLRFIDYLRSAKAADTTATPPNVPIIAMTFFWRHTRFQVHYINEILSVPGPPIGYLPKYYWVEDENISAQGNAALKALLELLTTPNERLNKKLIPLLFDSIALDLRLNQNRFDLRDALDDLRRSYNVSCRSFVEMELLFEFSEIKKPGPDEDKFAYIMNKLKEGRAGNSNIRVAFRNVPSITERASRLDDDHSERKLGSHYVDSLVKLKGTQPKDPDVRKFALCWTLASYTFPLAKYPHCLSREQLAKLLTNCLGYEVSKEDVRSDIHTIRAKLQSELPDQIRGFVSAEEHLIVTERKKGGHYLNGTYSESWKSG